MPIENPLVPDEMLVLMKKLAYTVLKEKPENIPSFAADFFDKLIIERDGKLHKGYERFAAYEESLKQRKSVETIKVETPVESSQKLIVPNVYDDDDDEVFLSNKSGNVSKFDAVKPTKAKPRKLSSKKPSESLISITEETSMEVREFYTKQEKYRNAAMKIQAAFRKYLENKRNNLENDKIVQNAAIVIQKFFKSFIQKKRDEKLIENKIEVNEIEIEETTALNQNEEIPNLEDPEVEDAAIKIQKAFRGHLKQKEENEKTNKKSENSEMPSLDDPEVADAAIKIQKAFRGHLENKNKNQEESPTEINNSENEKDEMPNLDDPEVADAAIKIQKAFRGHLENKNKTKEETTTDIHSENEKDEMPNLDDPEIANAAVKIQKAFRGHLRQKEENEIAIKSEDANKESENNELPSLDDPEVADAAIKIQKAFRGHLKQKENKEDIRVIDIKNEISKLSTESQAEAMPSLDDPEAVDATVKIEQKELKLPVIETPMKVLKFIEQESSNQKEEMPDLNDPEVEKAASKIQKAFRSHVARKTIDENSELKTEEGITSAEVNDGNEIKVEGSENKNSQNESMSKQSISDSIDEVMISEDNVNNGKQTDVEKEEEIAQTLIENSQEAILNLTEDANEVKSEVNIDDPREDVANIAVTENEIKSEESVTELANAAFEVENNATNSEVETKEPNSEEISGDLSETTIEEKEEEHKAMSSEDKEQEELKTKKIIEGVIKFQKIYRGYIARKNIKKERELTSTDVVDYADKLVTEVNVEEAATDKLNAEENIISTETETEVNIAEIADETTEVTTATESDTEDNIAESATEKKSDEESKTEESMISATSDSEENLSKAASVIQKTYRTYKLRQLQSQKLIDGVIKFQRIYRGYIKRRNLEKQENSTPSETENSKINLKSLDSELKQQNNAGPINSKDDIENNLLNKEIIAAINIQRIYRGYKVRRDQKNDKLNKRNINNKSDGNTNEGEDDLKRQTTVEEEPCIKQNISVLGPDLSELTEFPESTDNETAPSTAEADSFNNIVSEDSEIPITESSENETTQEIEKIIQRIISENSEIPVTETSESEGNSTTDEFFKRDDDDATTGTEALSDADYRNDTVLSKISEIPSVTDDEANKTEIPSSDDEFINKVLTESNDGSNIPENETESSENFLKVTGSPDVENGSINRRNSSASSHNQLEVRLKSLRDQETLKYEESHADSIQNEDTEIPYERLQQSSEEEVEKNATSLKEDEHHNIFHKELKEIEDFDISNYEKDSLEAMYYSLKKNEVLIDKMHRRASLERSTDLGVEESKPQEDDDDDKDVTFFGDEVSFEPDSLNYSTNDFTDNSLGKIEEEREEISSDGSDKRALKMILDENNKQSLDVKIPGEVDEEFLNPIQYALKRSEEMKNQLHETEKIPITPEFDNVSTSYQEQNFDLTIEEDDYVEELGAPKSVRKFLASATSEADSDYFEPNRSKSVLFSDDFNISTALKSTSTDSESTINSAATKIQAGARGFLTRRRLHGSSKQSKDRPSSFGNAAIDKSLEDMIEQKEKDIEMEEAAIKIQTKYRSYRERQQLLQQNRTTLQETMDYSDEEVRGITEIKLEQKKINDSTSVESTDSNNISDEKYSGHPTIITVDANNDDKSSEDDVNQFKNSHLLSSLNFDELDTAARRSLYSITRDDAIQLSTPSDENEIDRNQTGDLPQISTKEGKQEKSRTSVKQSGKFFSSIVRPRLERQRTMPVQIDTMIIRTVPKHLRKRIKSADSIHKNN